MKLPRTLHIEGSRLRKGDHDPEAIQFPDLAEQFLTVEEKVDGTGVSLFFDEQLDLQIWHRGHPVNGKEFHILEKWVDLKRDMLFDLLEDRYVLFGEYCAHKHTIFYDNLPHFFLESDIYDKKLDIWLNTFHRNELNKNTAILQVPVLAQFKPSALSQITDLIGKTKYQSDNWMEYLVKQCQFAKINSKIVFKETDQSGLMEGLYIKQEDDKQVVNRYKYVRHDFLQTILNSGTHLIDRAPIFNLREGKLFSFN